jgi:hypothetical protein
MYHLSGLGDVATSDFVNRNGICKPTNFETLAKFKGLQNQLNRVAQVKGLTKIAVDGDIGPGTLRLLAATGVTATSDCSAVAIIAEPLTVQVQAVANAAGAPEKVSSPAPAATPSIVNVTTGLTVPQPAAASVSDAFGRMSQTQMVIAAVAIGGVAYLALGKKKRARRH